MHKLLLFLIGISLVLSAQTLDPKPFPLGAWSSSNGDTVTTMIIQDNYLSLARYDLAGKKFLSTQGGTITSLDRGLKGIMEFHTGNRDAVGKAYTIDVDIRGDLLRCAIDGQAFEMHRLDDGTRNLAGNWRITQRAGQDGQLVPIHGSGPRKTIKILSSTRFQWAAINTETGEFFGTGGGRYAFGNGKYTEMIEFFSRDSSRVGMSLTFDGRLEGKDWYHSGKSSKGDPVNEVWSRL